MKYSIDGVFKESDYYLMRFMYYIVFLLLTVISLMNGYNLWGIIFAIVTIILFIKDNKYWSIGNFK